MKNKNITYGLSVDITATKKPINRCILFPKTAEIRTLLEMSKEFVTTNSD